MVCVLSAAKAAKELGLKSLSQGAKLLNVHPDTLHNWFNDEPLRFEIVIIGCVEYLNRVGELNEESKK